LEQLALLSDALHCHILYHVHSMLVFFSTSHETMLNISLVILTCIEFSEAHIDLSTWTLTSAACLLPLSNVWAKSANEEDIRLSRASLNTSHVNLGYRNSNFPSQTSTAVYSERKGSAGQSYNKHNINTIIEHRSTVQSSRDSTEVDLERMGVRVDRSYSVLDQGR